MASELSKSLLNGRWQWILNVKRYQNRHTIDPLSVADHSWLTAILGIMIYDSIDFHMDTERTFEVRGDILSKAILHDVEESMTGDIPLEKETRIAMKHAKALVRVGIINILFPANLTEGYKREHANAKDDTISGNIIRYADMLSALIEALREKRLGNTNFDDVVQNAMHHLDDIVTNMIVQDEYVEGTLQEFFVVLTSDIFMHIATTYGIRARTMV